MAIEPPDPGIALQLAKDCEHDALNLGFRRGDAVRFLVPLPTGTSTRAWQATVQRERTVDSRTHKLLREGEPCPRFPERQFRSPAGDEGDLYVLADDGFEARAVPA